MIVLAIAGILFLLGIFLPFWGFCFTAILIAVVQGKYTSIILSLFADLLYGAPLGYLQVLIFPYTALTICALFARHIIVTYMRESRARGFL